jgi:photosystem II stability/assembly factor-like uncharacterized protein
MTPSLKILAPLLLCFASTHILTTAQAQWTQKSQGLEGCPITALYSDGVNIFAGSSVGVYGSTLTGNAWSFLNGPSSPASQFLNVNCIAGKSDNLFVGTPYGVQSSNGVQWTALRTGMQRAARSLLIYNNKIYAGANSGGVYVSENNGTSWTSMSTGLSSSGSVSGFERIANTLFIAASDGVFQTTDEGASWQEIHPENNLPGISALVAKDNMLFAGTSQSQIFISSNNGTSWSSWSVANSGLTQESDIKALEVHGGEVYAGTANGLYQYNAIGNSWSLPVNGMLNGLSIFSLYSTGTHFLAGTSEGVYISADNGITWTLRKNGLTCTQVSALVTLNGKLFAETDNGFFGLPSSSSAWSQIDRTHIGDVVVFNNKLFGSRNSGIVSSDDEGRTWKPAGSGIPANVTIGAITGHGTKLFAGRTVGTFYTDPVYVSSNEGMSWSTASAGLPQTALINAFASKEGFIFTAANGQVYRSADNGVTWTLSSTGLPPGLPYDYINFLKVHNNNLYTGFLSGGGLFRSSDNGVSWNAVNNGLPTSQSLFAMAASENNLFIGGRISEGQFGVYTCNSGDFWTTANAGLPLFQNRALIVNDNFLFGSFLGNNSVWSIPTKNIITSIEPHDRGTPLSPCAGGQINVYPNPALTSVRIDVNEAAHSLKEILICDIFGRRVSRRLTETDLEKTFNISDYPTGAYVIKVVYANETCYSKFVKQ